MMNDGGKSDRSVVAEKPWNKAVCWKTVNGW